MIRIKRGLDIPITGAPRQQVTIGDVPSQVGLIGGDYVGMKPTMLVAEGDQVKTGQPVFADKKSEGVIYTAPATGRVIAVNRGAKRRFESLVIAVEGEDAIHREVGPVDALGRTGVTDALADIGLWTSFRTRPFGKVPQPGSVPHSIFVTAIDTNPLSADPQVVLADRKHDFEVGLSAIRHLTDGKVYLCTAPKAEIPGIGMEGVVHETFAGPHPAGLPGTHIHYLDPVGGAKVVWYIGYQDVAAIGSFLQTGTLDTRRTVSLAGPLVEDPRLVQTYLGAELGALVAGELKAVDGDVRVISGSVLYGRASHEPTNFLGRYHTQVSVLREGNVRQLLGWQRPGLDKFSITRVFASSVFANRRFDLTTSTEGSERAMVPIGTYEMVMPLDILPTQLLRALIVRDTEDVQSLGALELEEEDLALCTFVCPGKYEYGSLLRESLTRIEIEG